jgi:hypothetical protein
MSLLSVIEGAEHSFAAFAEKEWTKLYNETPKLEQIVATTLKYVGPALQMIVTAEMGAPAGAIVGNVIKEAQSDLLAASSLIYDFGATPSVSSVFTGVNTDLSSLLSAGHITSSKSVSTVNRVISEIEVLANAIKNAVTAPAAVAAAAVLLPRA